MPRLPVLQTVARLIRRQQSRRTQRPARREQLHTRRLRNSHRKDSMKCRNRPGLHLWPLLASSPQTIWGFNGRTPGPLIVERYGNLGNLGAGSVLLRLRNNLPANNGGFGLPSVTSTCTTATRRSRAMAFLASLWNEASSTIITIRTCMPVLTRRIPARATSKKRCTLCGITITASITQPRTPTKVSPRLHSLQRIRHWQRKHGLPSAELRRRTKPTHQFRHLHGFNDKVFDNQTGLLKFDLFNTDGILGDKFLVNGKIQPVLHVSPRRYRFRWLNTGPSRFYQMFVLGPNNSTKSFWQISTDGNLLERPVQVNSSRFSVAERVDVIVDFTADAGKTFFLENRLEQEDGRGPTGNVLALVRATRSSRSSSMVRQ